MNKLDLSTIARTPVGVDERFDQSGRQEIVEQNGNDGAVYAAPAAPAADAGVNDHD